MFQLAFETGATVSDLVAQLLSLLEAVAEIDLGFFDGFLSLIYEVLPPVGDSLAEVLQAAL